MCCAKNGACTTGTHTDDACRDINTGGHRQQMILWPDAACSRYAWTAGVGV
jgi:hypothetical protein